MLTVIFYDGTVTELQGHAGVGKRSAPCIAASALAGVFAGAGDSMGGSCALSAGHAVLDFPATPEGRLLSEVFRGGMTMLCSTYPDKIRIIRKEKQHER